MFYKSFSVKNYRGINEIQMDLSNNRILTLVGLNESGKTTALEAVNRLYKCIRKQNPTPEDLNYFRPKGIAFTGTIFLEAKIAGDSRPAKQIQTTISQRNLNIE